MYENFHVTDRWTDEDLHCRWKANIVAFATRHADLTSYLIREIPTIFALSLVSLIVKTKRHRDSSPLKAVIT